MVNVYTWWVSLILAGAACGVAVHLHFELQRLRERNQVLRQDLRDTQDELLQLRTTLALGSPNVAGALFAEAQREKPSRDLKKEIETARRELKKWVKEDGR